MSSQSSQIANENAFHAAVDIVQAEMKRLQVPGVALGVFHAGQEQVTGLGITNVDHPLPVTPTTLFQIGSITKTFVATLSMRLVEMGVLELDTPIRNYLPHFSMADKGVTQRVTMRHLLTHTGGWVGDYFNDFGEGDNALQSMVEQVGHLPQIYPLGDYWSYNNSGFYLAGRVIEVLTGLPFETAMRHYILDPLGLSHTYFFPQEMMTERYAVGHLAIDHQAVVARPWAVPRAAAPAGGLVTDIPTLLRYARFHMGIHEPTDGQSLLSREAFQQMQSPFISATGFSRMGISWWIDDLDGVKMIRHGGGTKGQISHLAIIPERQFAMAICTNGEDADTVILAFRKYVLQAYLGLSLPPTVSYNLAASDSQEFSGEYEAYMDSLFITLREGELSMVEVPLRGFPNPDVPQGPPSPPVRLAFFAPDRIICLDEPFLEARGEFLRDASGKISWLRFGSRMHRKQ
jgi:CubicO group peptidase (beta-lactamase class C family)